MIKHSAHYIHFCNRRVRKVYCKAALAYGGAMLMTIDAGCAVFGPLLFPHLIVSIELTVSALGKIGAAASGSAVFFDAIIKTALKELETL